MNRGRHRKKTEFYSIQTLPPEIKQKILWSGGFSWGSTKEGFEYWDNILGKIKDLMKQRKKQKQDFK